MCLFLPLVCHFKKLIVLLVHNSTPVGMSWFYLQSETADTTTHLKVKFQKQGTTIICKNKLAHARGNQKHNLCVCVSVCVHKGQCCLFKAREQLIRSTGGLRSH